jgi:hypothetical protein
MICQACAKLAVSHKSKNCLICNTFIYINICKLCEACSAAQNKCASCMKNMIINPKLTNCSSCGRK